MGVCRTKGVYDIQGKEGSVPLLKPVKSKNTSRQCPSCKYIDKRNRKNQNQCECLQCHDKEMADYVVAKNIADKARDAVNDAMLAPLFTAVTSPHLGRVGR